jgi:hypothetical protein
MSSNLHARHPRNKSEDDGRRNVLNGRGQAHAPVRDPGNLYFFPNRSPKKSPLFQLGRAGMSASSRAIS